MNNLEIYENFLGSKEIIGRNEKFNLKFDINNSKEEFEIEYLKFISLYNYFFFDINSRAIMTIINSYSCTLDEDTIKYLINLYKKAKILNKNIYMQMIAEFIFSYKNSLETDKYRDELGQEKVRKYKGILYRNIQRNDFNTQGEIFKSTIKFYKNIINYARRKQKQIEIRKKIRMLSKFNENERDEKVYKEIFDYSIKENRHLEKLIKYDYNIKNHLEQYEKKILESPNNSYLSESSIEIFKEIVNNLENQEEFIKKYTNKYIKFCNELIQNVMIKKENSIIVISQIEQTIKELNRIKKLSINVDIKEKINECICKILCAKRNILSDTKYINRSLKQHEFKQKIPKKEVEKMREEILENFCKIYPYVKINFNNMISKSIQSYSEHPMMYITRSITITDNELYYMDEEIGVNSIFKSYYDNKGITYTKENIKKLRNLLQKDYYENMLKYTKMDFQFTIGLIASILYKDINKIKNNIELSRIDNNIKSNNLYTEMIIQIIGIEVNIYKLLKINNIEPEISIEKNLELLFEKYIENDLYREAIMNIYYILYCRQGENIRNDIMHGNLLHKPNYVAELIMIYSCIIAINYIVQTENNKIESNEGENE